MPCLSLPLSHPLFLPQPSPFELTDTLFSLSSPFTSLRPSCRPGTMPTLSPAAGRMLPWTNNISEAVSMPGSPIVCCQRGVNTHVWTQWIVLLCLRHAARPLGCTLPPNSEAVPHFSALNLLKDNVILRWNFEHWNMYKCRLKIIIVV